MAYYHALRKLASGDHEAAKNDLEYALEGDPSIVRAHLLLSLVYLREVDPRWIGALLEALRVFNRNFTSQSLFFANGVIYLLLFVLLALFGFTGLMLLRSLPAFRHFVIEALPANLRGWVREAYPPILVTSLFLAFHPWVWPGGIVWILVCSVLATWRTFTPGERGIATAFLVSIAIVPLLLKLAVGASLPAMPGSSLFAITASPLAPSGRTGPEAFLAASPGDGDLLFSLALLQRERGHEEEALRLYGEIVQGGGESAAVWNNMGNLEFLLGRPDRAARSYKRAVELDGRSASSHYNLGQLYLDRFDFERAREEFTTAATLDFPMIRTLSRVTPRVETTTLVDEALPVSRLWNRFLTGGTRRDGLTWGESLSSTRRLLFPLPAWAAIPIAALLFVSWRFGATRPRTMKCVRCGAVICRECRRRRDRTDVCPSCAEGSHSFRWAPGTVQYHRPVALSLGILFPGGAHLYLGRYVKGVLFAAPALAFLLGWACRGPVVKPFPILSAPALEPLENLLFAVVFVPLYGSVLFDAVLLIRRHFGARREGRNR